MARHHEHSRRVAGSAAEVFAFVDDHARFSSHMSTSSWMMGGARMRVETDAAHGRAVGSHIRLSGTVLGLRLHLDEVVTRREPPARKEVQTVGTPRLLVIGAYVMGIEVAPEGSGSRLRVFIDYEWPSGFIPRILSALFGAVYARWCVRQMVDDTARYFDGRTAAAA